MFLLIDKLTDYSQLIHN